MLPINVHHPQHTQQESISVVAHENKMINSGNDYYYDAIDGERRRGRTKGEVQDNFSSPASQSL